MIDFQTILLMAPPQGEGGSGGGIIALVPYLLIFVVIYFFMIRPQSKKAKEQREFVEGLKNGDKVVTSGGIHGKIVETRNSTFVLDLGNNNKITVNKGAVSFEMTKQSTDDQQPDKK